ncbi:Ribosomal protein S18 [Metarhizium album ARSEF 1941]|uniref:Small ribosomal subunit protein bS18m n=1 Tax=Metarhizium album (strain ARSEF 1941) TaxID=1081103 RepID=A0A0B2WSY6_METAS|nr:Ribosomal protein S18 [Metarhizium album ARSEF 1941]KHN96602.1 Ribosomal protein S18 [Metarhizium album ARSEF 1941]
MPARLASCALRALCPPRAVVRAFSCTPAVASPPREAPHPPSHHHKARPPTPSSSSNLLSMGADRHKRSPPVRAMRPGEAAANMMSRYTDSQNRSRLESIEALRNSKNSADYLKQMPRRWEAGDVYSPHDLSPVEMQKWRKRSLRSNDVVDALGIRPLDMYKNFSLVQEFTTSSGQIIHSAGTSLRPVNQRKIAKMIRRVQGMGIYPTIHDHPEMIRDDFFPDRR